MRKFNVLSVDWDYFIDATASERLELFPDGGNENLSDDISKMCWSGHYSTPELEKIKVDDKALNFLASVLYKVRSNIPVMMVDSHKYAYDFVLDNWLPDKYEGVNLVNVDFHHDAYSISDKLDCGNWLRLLIKQLNGTNSSFTWIKRTDSDVNDKLPKELKVTDDLKIIKKYKWDAVYICRSGMWSPPHLDKVFIPNFLSFLSGKRGGIYEEKIFSDRYGDVKKLSDELISYRHTVEEKLRNGNFSDTE